MRVHKLQLENPLWIYNQPNINFNWAPYFTPVIINILIIDLLYVCTICLHRPVSMSLGKDNNDLCSYSEDGNKVHMYTV